MEAIKGLTTKGRVVMTMIGLEQLSYFDEGVEPDSGSWGLCICQEANVRPGVLTGLRDQGLLRSTSGDSDEGDWWELTELGASVSRELASRETGEEVEDLIGSSKVPFRNRTEVKDVDARRKESQKAITKHMYRTNQEDLAAAIKSSIEDLQELAWALDLDIS